jgi:hypothetical protein
MTSVPIDRESFLFEERVSRSKRSALVPTTTTTVTTSGVAQQAARLPHKQKVVGSSPTPATTARRRANADGPVGAGSHNPTPPADFWRRLANCESRDGRGGNGGGFFQMVGHGYRPGLSYDQQVALAQAWAAKIHPREGTTAGWPHCWWVALR